MSKKVNEMLDAIDQAVDRLSPDELARILISSGITQEIANNYAYLETCVISYRDYENLGIRKSEISASESEDISLAA